MQNPEWSTLLCSSEVWGGESGWKLQLAWDVEGEDAGQIKMDLGTRTVNPFPDEVGGGIFCFVFKPSSNLLVHVLKDWCVNTWKEHFAGNKLESPICREPFWGKIIF